MKPVTALLGPTNTGKTYLALERMLAHRTGMIGFPLRLLARENYDRVAAVKGKEAVALVTGEERIVPRHPRYFVCTVEAMPSDRRVDFLAVERCVRRPRARARLHGPPDERARPARDHADRSGDHPSAPAAAAARRRVPPAPACPPLRFSPPKKLARLRRSAVIVFSVRELYAIAGAARARGGSALVFGALSPRATPG
jgi:ATP-dependent RNA helicase SUPV3L1/SUV3